METRQPVKIVAGSNRAAADISLPLGHVQVKIVPENLIGLVNG
jgi:hypothetical protein